MKYSVLGHHDHYPAYFTHRRVKVSLNFCHSSLLLVFLIQSCPASLFMSSDHLVCGLPLLLLFSHGLHSIILRVHLLYVILPICPAQFYFSAHIFSMTSLTFVLFLISVLVMRSCRLMFRIRLSMARCVTCNLLIIFLFSAQISIPYVRTGRTYWSKTLAFIVFGMSDLKTSCILPNTDHAKDIRRDKSAVRLFLVILYILTQVYKRFYFVKWPVI